MNIFDRLRRKKKVLAATEDLQRRAYLIGIDRDGRVNRFVFVRSGEVFAIETMGLLSDDIREWKKDLLE